MKTTDLLARVQLLLAELRLPAAQLVWPISPPWPNTRRQERGRRRLERHLAEARLPPGKTLDAFDFEAVPVVRHRSWRSPPPTPG
jgi:DNA replication protein DnaC